MTVTIEHFPENRKDRQWCFVWTRKIDGERVRFGCDESKENCEVSLAQFRERARVADEKGLDVM